MNLEFPYQLTTFIDAEPEIGEAVYRGKNGWYPQIALKRRFKPVGITEDELIKRIATYCNSRTTFLVKTAGVIKPEHMPVKVLEIVTCIELIDFHNDFISFMADTIESRYPERDGLNYFPHVTAEFDSEMVIDVNKYQNRNYQISRVFLLKDIKDENSVAYKSFDL